MATAKSPKKAAKTKERKPREAGIDPAIVLAFLKKQKEGVKSGAIATELGESNDRTRAALFKLRESGDAVMDGEKGGATWRASSTRSKAA